MEWLYQRHSYELFSAVLTMHFSAQVGPRLFCTNRNTRRTSAVANCTFLSFFFFFFFFFWFINRCDEVGSRRRCRTLI